MEDHSSTYPHPWCKRVAAYLPDALFVKPMSEQDARWRRVQQLLAAPPQVLNEAALDDVIQGCLTLLEHHTKDMRVLHALLMCQWRRQTPDALLVGMLLLSTWIDCAWARAAPMSMQQKATLLTQLLAQAQRCAEQVHDQWHAAQHAQASAVVTALIGRLRQWLPEQAELGEDLVRCVIGQQAPMEPSPEVAGLRVVPSSGSLEVGALPWRDALLQMAQRLNADAPHEPVGYLLRRHAMWSALPTVTPTQGEMTALAPPSAQHIRAGMACLNAPTLRDWHAFETLLESAPCWFDGQRLSAAIAAALGCTRVSQALHEASTACLTRHPDWHTLTFEDGTPFLSARSQAWLAMAPATSEQHSGLSYDATSVQAPAERALTQVARDDFYAILAQADTWRDGGLYWDAEQRYRWLLYHARQRGLATWEPALVAHLSDGLAQCLSSQGGASSA